MYSNGGRCWHLEVNIFQQVEVLCIEPVVLQQLRVVQVVGVVSGHGEVTEAHDLL